MADITLKKIYVKVWRQNNAKAKGSFETYEIENISQGSSFLEMLDILNDKLIRDGKDPIAFDHDCREGICGMCSLYVNGRAHGPDREVTTCQLHMRRFSEGETITIEPWRAGAGYTGGDTEPEYPSECEVFRENHGAAGLFPSNPGDVCFPYGTCDAELQQRRD